jgi:hypothetical protein
MLSSIQVLRALAALAVAFAHIWPVFAQYSQPDAVPNFILGAAGVDLFFVISGFIMVYTSEPMFGQPGAPTNFLLRRIIRIVLRYQTFDQAGTANDITVVSGDMNGDLVADFEIAIVGIVKLSSGDFLL